MKIIKDLGMRRDKNGHMRRRSLFLCGYCGEEIEKLQHDGMKCKSCGCMHNKLTSKSKITHGLTNTRLYTIWCSMKQRCYTKTNDQYKWYGKRGISVCEQWKDYFIIFYIWSLMHGYKEGLTIDRENNDGNYEPFNCRWVTNKVNIRNSRHTKLTMGKADQIRKLYFNLNGNQEKISWLFNVNQSTVSHIVNNKIWIK